MRGCRSAALRRAGAVGVIALATAACGPGFESWAEGSVHGQWRTVFSGLGQVGRNGDGTIALAPQRPVGADTHAALVVSTTLHSGGADVTLRTTGQLRTPPNAWERGWVLWNYADPKHFYYVTLKDGGWEVGKEDPGYPGGQRFLATGPGRYRVGDWHEVQVGQDGPTITVAIDGVRVSTVVDTDRPYLSGNLGLYAEDARAEFRPR